MVTWDGTTLGITNSGDTEVLTITGSSEHERLKLERVFEVLQGDPPMVYTLPAVTRGAAKELRIELRAESWIVRRIREVALEMVLTARQTERLMQAAEEISGFPQRSPNGRP